METKTVTAGMRNTTISLNGTECSVKFSDNYRYFEVLNDSDGDVTMSIYKGKKAGEDGVITVHPGMAVTLAHMRTDINTVYITGSGTVQVAAKNTAAPVFNKRLKGGDGNEQDIRILAFGLQVSGFDVNVSSNLADCKKAVREKIYYLDYSGTIFIYNGRTVSRSTDLPAYCAYFWRDGWFTPCVISKNEEAVAYRIYLENSVCQGSIEYMGKTWYYNMYSGGSYQNVHDSSEYKRYFLGSYTSAEEAEVKPVYDLLDLLKSIGEV